MTTSHWDISFWLDCVIICTCVDCFPLHLIAKNNKDNQSNIMEIHIQIHTKFTIIEDEIAVIIDNITKRIMNQYYP